MEKLITLENVRELTREAWRGAWRLKCLCQRESVQPGALIQQLSASPAQGQDRQAAEISLRSLSSVSTASYSSRLTRHVNSLWPVAYACFLWWAVRAAEAETCLYPQLFYAGGLAMWIWCKHSGAKEFTYWVQSDWSVGSWNLSCRGRWKEASTKLAWGGKTSGWRTDVLGINEKGWKYMRSENGKCHFIIWVVELF